MIKTNKQVIQDFVNGRSSKNMNLTLNKLMRVKLRWLITSQQTPLKV